MTKLFSYVIPNDHGAAPNPFGGVCTLVICKPRIRSAARVNDWVVGTGSKYSPIGDIRDKLVYAMQVTDKMTMREYDAWAQEHRPEKVPKRGGDPRSWVGDAIYDFTEDPPLMRSGVHGPGDRVRDLGGKHALLSEHFFYFGDHPVALPENLRRLVHSGQAHSSDKNAEYLEPFVDWLTGLRLQPNRLYGRPQGRVLARNRAPDIKIQNIRRK